MRVNKLLSCLFVASFICYIISAVCSYSKQVINNTDESSSKFSVTYYKNSTLIRWEDDEVFCYYPRGYGGISCFLKEKKDGRYE